MEIIQILKLKNFDVELSDFHHRIGIHFPRCLVEVPNLRMKEVSHCILFRLDVLFKLLSRLLTSRLSTNQIISSIQHNDMYIQTICCRVCLLLLL